MNIIKGMDDKKHIHICALGGTIAMVPSSTGAGVHPTLTSDDLLAAVPKLQGYARFTTHTLAKAGSANLTFEHALRIVDYAEEAENDGADAIIVTQGTDTLEEISFIISLVWSGSIPIIFTAAMRHPASEGADGPSNLLAAVQVACQVNEGVYVVMHNELHDPSYVQKCHTTALSAFLSEKGPAGTIVDGHVKLTQALSVLPRLDKERLKSPYRVALLSPAFDDEPWQLEAALDQKFDAMVIASFGGGHVSELWADALRPVAAKMPVILASRVGRGQILNAIYGYKGAEIDLMNAGLISAGRLDARKARLFMALQRSLNPPEIRKGFNIFLE